MTYSSGLKESSIVEYSLAELGFVLVFVLLLLTGWEINTNADKLEKEAEAFAQIKSELEAVKIENKALKEVVSSLSLDASVLPDDFMLVDKAEYLALESLVEYIQPSVLDALSNIAAKDEKLPDDPVIVSESGQVRLKEEKELLEEDKQRLQRKLAAIEEDSTSASSGNSSKVGTVGFCTYDPPRPGRDKVYGKSVAIGTLVVGENGLTLVEKNIAIKYRNFVDIAGDPYDTTLVSNVIDSWPLGEEMSREEFQKIGRKFMDIGRIPSEKRVGCRFGMDYFIPVVNEKSLTYLENQGLQGSFFKNMRLSESAFRKRFPEYYSKHISNKVLASSSLIEPKFEKVTEAKIVFRAETEFPKKAAKRGKSGLVELAYKVSAIGVATKIEVVKEEPPGFGFGEAAISALERYKFMPASLNDLPLESDTRRIRFRF